MTAPRRPSPYFHPHGLWSLWDMLTQFASHFIKIGEELAEAHMVFHMAGSHTPDDPESRLTNEEKNLLNGCLEKIVNLCGSLDLPISGKLFGDALENPPQTLREFEILTSALNAEMKSKLFVFVPTHRQRFMQPRHFMGESTKDNFPKARQEMANAGRCHAVGMYTASVFHSMRAVEIGLKAMAIALRVEFDFPLEQANQEDLIRGIEAKIKAKIQLPKSAEKDADLAFYSENAMQFRYFKDGWRVRVAHARETYEEPQSLGVLEHAATFITALSNRLSEPSGQPS